MSTRTRRIRRRRKREAERAMRLVSTRSLMSTAVLHHAAQAWAEPLIRVQVDALPGLERIEVEVIVSGRANGETHYSALRVRVQWPGQGPRRLRWLRRAVRMARHRLHHYLNGRRLEADR